MSNATAVRVDLALRPASPARPNLFRWVCTNNPFYVLSALLVCLGLRVSFGDQVVATQTWSMLIGMASYTLLLAVTACLLVRFVGVWDDVRTVLLLVVLMFLATSVTFDEVLARIPSRGVACYLGGLLFAVVVSEGMLRGVRLALPPLFRLPYYLALALFFLYPVAITPLLDQPRSEALYWALFGFAPAAGIVALTLLPAVRRGHNYVRANGSPWPWAWYPWILFGLLAFAVPARSALLCWSMHHVSLGASEPYIFGPYFLVPFVLGVAVVLLEIGLVERHSGVGFVAVALPIVSIVLAAVGHRPEAFYQEFLALFIARLGGTPLYLALLAAVGFYAYAALRRVPLATELLSLSLAALAFVAPATLDLDNLGPARPVPIFLVAVLELGLGLRARRSLRCLIGACFLAMAATLDMPPLLGGIPRGLLGFHLLVVAMLAVGAVFHDSLGRMLRTAGAGLVLMSCVVILSGRSSRMQAVPVWALQVYPLVMALLIIGYGFVLKHRLSVTVAGMILGAWLVAFGWKGYLTARQAVVGLDYLVLGMILFALAVLTSAIKGGVLSCDSGSKHHEAADSIGPTPGKEPTLGEPLLQ